MKPIPASFSQWRARLRRLILPLAAIIAGSTILAAPLGTTFTYQGFLSEDGAPAQGTFDLRSILYNAEVGGSQVGNILTNQNVLVESGLLNVSLDFGAGLFDGEARWLELAIRPAGTGLPFMPLTPRQPLRATPYASHALAASTAFMTTTADVANQVPWSGIIDIPPDFADGIDRDTTYDAGEGLNLTDTTFSIANQGVTTSALADQAVTPAKLDFTNADPDHVLLFDGAAVIWTNVSWNSLRDIPPDFADGIDRDTTYEAGAGLELTDSTFHIQFDGTGTATTAARSDHSHPPGDAATLGGLEPADFASAIHTHTFEQITGIVAQEQLPSNLAQLNADQSFIGINEFEGVTALSNPANVVHGTFTGDGAGLDNLQGNAIASQSITGVQIAPTTIQPDHLDLPSFPTTFWRADGNPDTTSGTHFLGTTDPEPLELRVNNTRALRLAPNSTNSVNLLAGSAANDIDDFTIGATIAGGGAASHLGFPHANQVYGDFGTIGGGSRNLLDLTADWSTIAGGLYHTIELNSQWSTISGGRRNTIGIDADFAVIGGGVTNSILPGADSATIPGGAFNTIGTNAHFATIPGGRLNRADGRLSLAAGHNAHALHDGSFVWADSTPEPVASSETNQFTLRATGGVRLFTDTDLTTGVELDPGSGTWTTLSDRDAKTNFQPVDPRAILDQLQDVPILYWTYQSQPTATRHLGPVAQDFHAAFQLGSSPRRLATVDVDGVALAAIQGLNRKLEEELEARDRELRELRGTLATLAEQIVALQSTTAVTTNIGIEHD
jgi:hypothetical protein